MEIFAKHRNDDLDLSGLAAIDPQVSLLPQIEAGGLMLMAGYFASVPSQVDICPLGWLVSLDEPFAPPFPASGNRPVGSP